MNRGKFIVFEGCEGSGKTTQSKKLSQWLESQGIATHWTREPGGTVLGRQLREFTLLSEIDLTTEIFLLLADRANHVAEIKQKLTLGYWVLCDRFTWSTLAYQGYGYGYSLESLEYLNSLACQGLSPDWTILLDINPRIGLARKQQQGELNKFEAKDIEFHDRVRDGYRQLFYKTKKDASLTFCWYSMLYCQSSINPDRQISAEVLHSTIVKRIPFSLNSNA